MKKRFGICLVIGIHFLSACSSFKRSEVTGLPLDPAERQNQESEIEVHEKNLSEGNIQQAAQGFQRFRSGNPGSPFVRRAQLGEAKALEFLGFWSEAADQYRDIIDSTRNTRPEIAAEALFLLSYCFESIGDEARVLAALQDAQRMSASLRPEIARAELPARLAASYQRMGMLDQVKRYLGEAEQGIQYLRSSSDKAAGVDTKYFARVYQQMGQHSTNQLSFESFQNNLETLKIIQLFALKSVELEDKVYSQKALDGLKENYRDLTTLAQQVPFNKALDFSAAKREQIERKSQMAGQILIAIEHLKRLRMVSANEPEMSKKLFSYLAGIEEKLNLFLNQRGELNSLTPDAIRLKEIKKDIIIKSEPIFPNEGK